MIGVVDVTGPERTFHPTTFALVVAAARLAEGFLRAQRAVRDERLLARNLPHLVGLRDEPGAAAVEAVLDQAAVSAVNLSEVQAKLVERGTPAEIAWSWLVDLDLAVVDFDAPQARLAGDFGRSPQPAVCRLPSAPVSRWPRASACRR